MKLLLTLTLAASLHATSLPKLTWAKMKQHPKHVVFAEMSISVARIFIAHYQTFHQPSATIFPPTGVKVGPPK